MKTIPNHSRTFATFGLFFLAYYLLLGPSPVTACPYSIRDSAFIGSDNLPSFQLLLITDSTDESLYDSVDTATVAWLSEGNVVAEVVPIDSATVRGIRDQLPLEELSARGLTAALISPQGRVYLLGSLPPEEITLDSVMQLISSAVDSSLRSQLRIDLLQAWAVLLVVHGGDTEAAEQVATDARLAGERIVGTTTEMDKTVEQPPLVVVLDREDPEEQVLLWSLGLQSDADDEPDIQVAMITGRGELRGPVLKGDAATEEAIFGLLEMLGRNCTCTTDDAWHTGPVIPLEWTDDMQASVEDTLGFDPEDPEAIGTITGVMTGLAGSLGYQEAALEYEETLVSPPSEAIATDEVEPPLPTPQAAASGDEATAAPSPGSDDKQPAAPSPNLSNDDRPSRFNTAAMILGGGIGFLIAATIILLLNSTRT